MRPEHWLYTVPLRLRSLFRRERIDQELEDKLRDHVERKTEDYVGRGLAPGEARHQALLDVGGVEQTKEKCRDMRGLAWLESVWQVLRFGFRLLAKKPGFTALAIFPLAVGTATNTAVFTAFNATALRPIQASDPGRVVAVYRSVVGDVNATAFNY